MNALEKLTSRFNHLKKTVDELFLKVGSGSGTPFYKAHLNQQVSSQTSGLLTLGDTYVINQLNGGIPETIGNLVGGSGYDFDTSSTYYTGPYGQYGYVELDISNDIINTVTPIQYFGQDSYGYEVGMYLFGVYGSAHCGIFKVTSVDVSGKILALSIEDNNSTGIVHTTRAITDFSGGLGTLVVSQNSLGEVINVYPMTPGSGYQVGDLIKVGPSNYVYFAVTSVSGGGGITGVELVADEPSYRISYGLSNISASGSNATAYAELDPSGSLLNLTLVNQGGSYQVNDTLKISISGTDIITVNSVGGSGEILTFTITNSGVGIALAAIEYVKSSGNNKILTVGTTANLITSALPFVGDYSGNNYVGDVLEVGIGTRIRVDTVDYPNGNPLTYSVLKSTAIGIVNISLSQQYDTSSIGTNLKVYPSTALGVITNATVSSETIGLDYRAFELMRVNHGNYDSILRILSVDGSGTPLTLEVVNGGTNQYFNNYGGSGNGQLYVDMTVVGGVVTSVSLPVPSPYSPDGYTVGDIITISAGDYNATFEILSVEGDIFTNTGFVNPGVPFAAIATAPTSWAANTVVKNLTLSAPVARVFEEGITGITFQYVSPGSYLMKSAAKFTQNKSFLLHTKGENTSDPIIVFIWVDSSTYQIYTNGSDGYITELPISLEVRP